MRTAATPATTRSTPRRAATPSGIPWSMSATTATTATASTATAAGTATGATKTRTTTTTCGQQMSGESAVCMPGHLAEEWVLTLGEQVCCSTAPTEAINPRADRVAVDCVQCTCELFKAIPEESQLIQPYRTKWKFLMDGFNTSITLVLHLNCKTIIGASLIAGRHQKDVLQSGGQAQFQGTESLVAEPVTNEPRVTVRFQGVPQEDPEQGGEESRERFLAIIVQANHVSSRKK